MKNGLRLIVIVRKTAVAAYLIGCVGLSRLQQLRHKLERSGRMQPKSIEMIRQSQKQECQFASLEDTVARLPEPFVAEAPGRSRGNRTRPIGDQTEEFHPHALTTYAALASTESLSVPDDVALRIRLDDTLTSIDSQIGDPFSATVVDKGDYQSARVYGHIAQIDMSGKIKGHTSMLFRRGDQRPY